MGQIPVAFALFGLAIAAFIGLVLSANDRQKKAMDAFFAQLDGLGVAGEGAERRMQAGAHEVRTDYSAGSKNSPSRFSLIAPVAAEGGFAVEREGAADRFLEGLGLEGKIATNDPDFDSRFHVVCDDDEFAAAYFASAEKRRAVVALFGLGAVRVELGSEGLKAVWSPFGFEKGRSAAFVRDALPPLAALCESLPRGAPPSPAPALGQKLFSALFVAGLVAGYVALVFMPIVTRGRGYLLLDGADAFWASLRYSGAAFAVYLAGAAAVLRGRSWFLKGFGQALVAGLLLFGAGGYWGVVWANCALDSSAAAAHACPVVGKFATRHKSATYYHAVVRSWRGGRQTETLDVGGARYGAIQPGRTLALVETKPGALGLEWVTRLGFGEPRP